MTNRDVDIETPDTAVAVGFGRLRRWIGAHRKWLVLIAIIVWAFLGFSALHQLTREIRFADLRAAMAAIGPDRLAAAIAFTVLSYLALTLYDMLALRIIGRPLRWRTAALASFTGYTISHNLGMGWLTGGSARYRVYTSAGLDGADVTRIVLITGVAFLLGVAAVAAIALVVHVGPLLPSTLAVPQKFAPILGAAILVAIAALIVVAGFGPQRIRIFGWRMPLPRPRLMLAQIVAAVIDLAAASTALFVLVPDATAEMLPAFILAYALGIIVSLISNVPGGVGVFEAVMIASLPGDRADLFAALIVYRVIYYLLPLALGASLLAFHEGRRFRSPAGRVLSQAQAVASGAAPLLMAVAAFAGGCVLLLSGSLPAVPVRLDVLTDVLPLPFIEASHIAASLVGTVLLLMAPALYRRLDGAFVVTRALLIAGAIFSLFKGFDYEEAIILSVIAGFLQWTRPAFYRRTTLTAEPFSARWVICVAAVLGIVVWVGFFAYWHVEYRDSLWWQFALSGDAPRFMRASLAVAVLLLGVLVWRLLSASSQRIEATGIDPAVLQRALASANRADAMLAYTGDKRFLASEAGDAFVMYQMRGTTCVVMGNPVGPREAWPDLLWRIRSHVDAMQGRLLLYEIDDKALSIAIEMGLHIIKWGEEARIDLTNFSLEGPEVRSIRQTDRRAAREGAAFAVVRAADVATLLPELRAVSDQWLAAKAQTEKAFSLGRFDPNYLSRFDLAVVRHEGRIVAFANIWATPNREELSVDLMRHADAMPYGTMDFLFVQLMLWGKAQGFRRFSLGLAPLSGIESRNLSPAWAKAATLVFRRGERFYGFKGLRAYKGKFAPTWEPRYIAGPGGASMVHALFDLYALISGGGRDEGRDGNRP